MAFDRVNFFFGAIVNWRSIMLSILITLGGDTPTSQRQLHAP
nr:MAG TPA_asm: hypothetical protein [Caudoviricetes sp.]